MCLFHSVMECIAADYGKCQVAICTEICVVSQQSVLLLWLQSHGYQTAIDSLETVYTYTQLDFMLVDLPSTIFKNLFNDSSQQLLLLFLVYPALSNIPTI